MALTSSSRSERVTTVATNGRPVRASAHATTGAAPYASVPPKTAITEGTDAVVAAGGAEGRRSTTSSRRSA